MRPDLLLHGGAVLDVATGQTEVRDVGIRDGVVVTSDEMRGAHVVDASGLTVMYGLWDCHAHPGSLMYDPPATGYFETVAARTLRAVDNVRTAARMGITGVRATGEPDDIDIELGKATAAGMVDGSRVLGAGPVVRTTGGHGTAYPREYLRMQPDLVVDGPNETRRAVRSLNERGARWVKLALTGGLYSEHESVDGNQFDDDELVAAMRAAADRGLPVAAHCGSSRVAVRFAQLGGRSVEHGYALDEEAAAMMAKAGTWLVPTIGVTHDQEMMIDDGWPPHAKERAIASAATHAESLRICIAAGVRIATGADLNPIGPRLHRELAMLEVAGMSRLDVLRAATAGGRELNGFGTNTTPTAGDVADLIVVDGDPLQSLDVLTDPHAVIVHGRLLFDGQLR